MKQQLEKFIEAGYTIKQISLEISLCEGSVKKLLNMHGLKTQRSHNKPLAISKTCTQCLVKKPIDEFYWKNTNKTRKYPHCGTCHNKYSTNIQRKAKQEAIDYKGGKCEKCGYKACNAALEFHHTDPTKKDFTISKRSVTVLSKIKKELDKCMLLCANCHREIHNAT